MSRSRTILPQNRSFMMTETSKTTGAELLEMSWNEDAQLRRNRFRYQLVAGLAVIMVSFFYGLAVGLKRPPKPAIAWQAPLETLDDSRSASIPLPHGVQASSLGKNLTLNGKPANMVSFMTTRPVPSVLREIVAQWQGRGYRVVGATSDKRGVAVGTSADAKERFFAVVWMIPPPFRKFVPGKHSVQGMLSVGSAAVDGASSTEERQGEVPGIPVIPGGKTGSVLSSQEVAGARFTGVYTNPGTVADNLAFYKDWLSREGWVEQTAGYQTVAADAGGLLSMIKGEQEAVLILAPLRQAAENRFTPVPQTVVTVGLGPRM